MLSNCFLRFTPSVPKTVGLLCALLCGVSLAQADVLGEWTFDNGATSAERRAATNLSASVASLSALEFNTFEDVGSGAVPSSEHDGIGFGGNQGENVAFIHRANYFDGSAVPPKETASDFTSFGDGASQGTSAGQGDGHATISFTVSAGVEPLQIESITVDQIHQTSASLIVGFQEADTAAGATVTLNVTNNGLGTAYLTTPVFVGAGQSKTFTISLNSGALNSIHNVNFIQLNGAIAPEYVRSARLGQWTFNDGASSAQRLQSSGAAAGVTLSALAIHPEVTDFGNGVVPSGDDDGAGYGGNSGEMVLFWKRANYTNDSAPVHKFTTWGVPGVDTGIDTTVAKAPMSFTVTAGATQTITVERLLILSSNGTGGCRAHFQEAGQTAGGAHGGWGNSLVPLNEPVVIAPGTTKTFTINWSGDELDIKQNIDHIDLHGSIRTGGAQTTSRTQFSSATGTATPPQGWAFKWNAPSGWVAGVEPGDLSSGAITDTNSWTDMQWGGGVWSADGNSNGVDSLPDKFIRVLGTGGHPGEAGASRDLDRYAIAVFTVDAAGDYQLGQGWIEKASPSGNGLLVKIFSQGQLVKTVKCDAGAMAQFEACMEGLSVGDEIAVAVGSAGDPAYDSYQMDFEIARVDPSFIGLPVFEVAAYGAVGDGSTDDFDAIQAAVDAALAAGGGIVRFDGTKTYRIIGNETGDNDVERVFDLEGAFNIKIEGNGAELVLHAPDSLAYITYCENIQLDGFTVRFDPLPYYQGTIDAIDVANLTMDITVPARYPEPEVGTDTAPQSHPFFGRSFIPESPGARAGSGYHLYIDSTETIGGDPRKIRLHFTDGTLSNNEGQTGNMTENLQATLDEGATEMVVPHVRYGHRGSHNIVVSHSSRVKVSNILYRNTPFFLCAPGSNLGPVTIANFDVLTADPANELFVTWRDGFHVKDNAYGITIEDGDWHGGAMNDDLFNFAHMMKQVTAVSGTELSLVAAAGYGGQNIWHAGDWISVWDPTQTILRGRARIVGPGSTATWAASLTLDREIAATVDDWVVNDSRSNRGMLVRDCTNHRLGARSGSARFRTPAVRFENSHFDGIYFHLHSTTVHEGPVPRDYHFENTYFKGSMSSLTRPVSVTAGEDIVFKNCTVDEGSIFGRNGSDLSLDGVDWINQSADVLDLQGSTVAYVYNQSTRNASEVLLADVSLDSSSLVFFEEARFLQGLSPTTGVFPFANLLAIFNDPIQVGSGDIIVRNLTDGIDTHIQTADTSQVSIVGRELRIDPAADLVVGKDYAVLIEAGALLDADGVALDGFSSESTWTFSVLDPATANIVLNGDFSENAAGFTEWPGYLTNNGNPSQINSWGFSKSAGVNGGINGVGLHTPFGPSNQTAVTYYGFLQSVGTQFSQDLTGRLAPKRRYQISFKAANRSGNSSALGQVTVGDDSTTFYDSGVQSWSTAAFQSVTAEFTTGAAFDGPVVITLRNDSPTGDLTVNYSDVEIVKIDSYAVWVETYPGLDLSDPNGDLEPDGIPHHMEFALGGHPNVDDADTLMPTCSSDGSSLNFIFRRADLAIGSDYEPYTAYSLNLLDWYPVTHGSNGMTISVNDDGAATGVDEVTVEVDYGQADQDRMFLRLIVP